MHAYAVCSAGAWTAACAEGVRIWHGDGHESVSIAHSSVQSLVPMSSSLQLPPPFNSFPSVLRTLITSYHTPTLHLATRIDMDAALAHVHESATATASIRTSAVEPRPPCPFHCPDTGPSWRAVWSSVPEHAYERLLSAMHGTHIITLDTRHGCFHVWNKVQQQQQQQQQQQRPAICMPRT